MTLGEDISQEKKLMLLLILFYASATETPRPATWVHETGEAGLLRFEWAAREGYLAFHEQPRRPAWRNQDIPRHTVRNFIALTLYVRGKESSASSFKTVSFDLHFRY